MKKGMMIGAVIAIIVIIVISIYFINIPKDEESPDTLATNSGNITAISEISASIDKTQTYNIEIKNFAFNSAILNIKVGDTIIWTNKDSVKHTATSDSGDELASPLVGEGETYSHKFETAGTYDYHCTPHPSMKSKVVVI